MHDDADFAAAVELELAQALAADEEGRAVADDGADVQAQAGQRPGRDAVQALVDLADDADLDAGLAPLGERAQRHAVGDLDVVDQQLLARPGDERGQRLARDFSGLTTKRSCPGVYGCRVESAVKSVHASFTSRLSLVTTPKLRLLSMSSRV